MSFNSGEGGNCEETETILDLTNPAKKTCDDVSNSTSVVQQRQTIAAKAKLPKPAKTAVTTAPSIISSHTGTNSLTTTNGIAGN